MKRRRGLLRTEIIHVWRETFQSQRLGRDSDDVNQLLLPCHGEKLSVVTAQGELGEEESTSAITSQQSFHAPASLSLNPLISSEYADWVATAFRPRRLTPHPLIVHSRGKRGAEASKRTSK